MSAFVQEALAVWRAGRGAAKAQAISLIKEKLQGEVATVINSIANESKLTSNTTPNAAILVWLGQAETVLLQMVARFQTLLSSQGVGTFSVAQVSEAVIELIAQAKAEMLDSPLGKSEDIVRLREGAAPKKAEEMLCGVLEAYERVKTLRPPKSDMLVGLVRHLNSFEQALIMNVYHAIAAMPGPLNAGAVFSKELEVYATIKIVQLMKKELLSR